MIDETNDQPQDAEPPAEDRQPAETEGPPAEDRQPAETEGPPAEEPPAEQAPAEPPAAEQAPPADPPAAEQAPSAEPSADDQPPEDDSVRPEGQAAPKSDQPPGAELEPIALEPERELSAEERARLEAEEEDRARLEAEQTAGDEPLARSGPQVQVEAGTSIQATGKRKSSIARVLLRTGSGEIEVNDRPFDEYFPRAYLRTLARQPLLTAGYESTLDVKVRVHGGGVSGQASAVRHGIARALCEIDPELRPELKRRGLLTRDARRKERRKAGLKKARKRPQFSKR